MVFFSNGRGGGEQVDHGYKGKGSTSHLLVEKSGKPLAITSTAASGDERKQVSPLLNKISGLIKKVWNQGKVPILEADKGYDSLDTRIDVLSHKVFPLIPRRKNTKEYKRQGTCYLEKQRWVVERTISWLKTSFRRLTVRWERKAKYWNGFLTLGLIGYWVNYLSRWMY
ncbi:MAG TPA: transposase [Chlamydiales bacterium]|nr:transposase [Chlamydiales bacterium]